MKQAKATVAEAEKLLRWLQQQDDAPPYNRTIGGYLLMLENCADPAKDYIDWKPGTSPKEIFALQQRAEKAEADNAALRALLSDFIDNTEVPAANCSCHLSPPCNDCVEYGTIRELVAAARAALAQGGAK